MVGRGRRGTKCAEARGTKKYKKNEEECETAIEERSRKRRIRISYRINKKKKERRKTK